MVVYRGKQAAAAATAVAAATLRPAAETAAAQSLSGYIARINAIIIQLNQQKDKNQAMDRLTTLKQEIMVVKQSPA